MSGPKGGGYSVEENRMRELARRQQLLRELSEAQRALRAAEQRAAALCDEGADIDLAMPKVSVDESNASSIIAALAVVQRRSAELLAATRREADRLERAHIRESLMSGIGPAEALRADDAVTASLAASTLAELDAISAEVESVVGALDDDAVTGVDEVRALARDCLTASNSERPRMVARLEARVRTANAAAAERRGQVERARELRLELFGLPGIDELLRRLEEVVSGEAELTELLEQQVAQHVATATAAADRQYAAEMLREALEELGYQVGDAFVTDLGAGGTATVEKAGWTEHLLQVSVGAGQQLVLAAVRDVADLESAAARTDQQRLRDTEVEEEFCATFEPLTQAWAARGVRLGPVRALRAGEHPMNAVVSTRAARRGRTAARDDETMADDL